MAFLCISVFGFMRDRLAEARLQVASHRSLMKRIVGGAEVKSNVYPFFVNLGGCGGSLIHGDLVLTAAHVSSI
jgi:secreted trypsin-like serine protease